jgi:hypothetical protein
LPALKALVVIYHMPKINLSDDEHAAVVALVRRTIAEDKFPFAPRREGRAGRVASPAPLRSVFFRAPAASAAAARRV